MVRRHSSKFRVNCAVLDTSMKFGIPIGVTNTNILRYTAKPELPWFPWKPQLIQIHEALVGLVYHTPFNLNYALPWQR